MLQLVLDTEEVLRDYLVIISKYQILKFAYTQNQNLYQGTAMLTAYSVL